MCSTRNWCQILSPAQAPSLAHGKQDQPSKYLFSRAALQLGGAAGKGLRPRPAFGKMAFAGTFLAAGARAAACLNKDYLLRGSFLILTQCQEQRRNGMTEKFKRWGNTVNL